MEKEFAQTSRNKDFMLFYRKRVTMNFAKVDLKHGHSSLTNEKDHLYFLNRFVCVGEFFDG